MSKIKRLLNGKNDYEYDVLVATQPNSSYAESYRKIPINLKYINVDKEPKVIQVSSALPGEYKTTISANLAAVYSEQGANVVLLDCDLRKPKLHRACKVVNDVGLTNFLADKIPFSELVKKTQYGFDVITAGEQVPYPHVILNSQKFNDLMKELRKKYDYIIVDSPPVLLVTDSLILSDKVDTVLFVINQVVSKKSDTKEALRIMNEAEAKIGGIILSRVEESTMRYTHYGKYKYY